MVMPFFMTIYEFIKQKQTEYRQPIELADGWRWNMHDHLRRSFLYKNSQFEDENDNRELRPNKNIILPILNVQYRTEGFDVKDIELYVDDKDEYYKSFLVRKYHNNKWAPENFIDTFIDELVESYVDYGGVLIRRESSGRPEVMDLRSLAFCNQKNILANPFCFKHSLSPAELREYTDWGQTANGATISIEGFIDLCKDEKEIFVYELHGVLPREWLGEGDKKDILQAQIVAFYQPKDSQDKEGVTLYKRREPKLPFKFLSRDEIRGRALGRGGIEELFEPQVWTNWNEIKITEMLEAASKMIPWTTDKKIASKHPSGLKGMDNLEFLELTEGSQVGTLDTYPRNLVVFNNAMERWQNQAQLTGAVSETLLGETPSAGTPFKLFEAKQIEDKSMHRYRQGKLATFMDEVYRDWIISDIERDLTNDQEFLSELSADEMQEIAENVVNQEYNRFVADKIINSKLDELTPEKIDALKNEAEVLRTDKKLLWMKNNKKFIQVFKKEFTKKLGVMTNIAGKQKNLALLTDKVVNVLRQYLSTPQIRQDPEMTKLLNVILESSGLSPIMFGSQPQQTTQPPQPPQPANASQPLRQLQQLQTQLA